LELKESTKALLTMFYQDHDPELKHGITYKFLKDVYSSIGLLQTTLQRKTFY